MAAAVSVAGMGSVFTFIGFLPFRGTEREQRLKYISSLRHTVVFFESPHRIQGTLQDLKNHLDTNRSIVFCRELTKMYEEVVHCSNIDESIEKIDTRNSRSSKDGGGIRGEFTIVIGPSIRHIAYDGNTAVEVDTVGAENDNDSNIKNQCMMKLRNLRDDGLTRSEAVKLLASMYIGNIFTFVLRQNFIILMIIICFVFVNRR